MVQVEAAQLAERRRAPSSTARRVRQTVQAGR